MNITKETELFLNAHPYLKQALKNNVINYSKLSRLISKETGMKSKEAILIACRRFFRKVKDSNNEIKIIKLLKESDISIKNNISVLILDTSLKYSRILKLQTELNEKNEKMHVVRSENAITLILNDKNSKVIERKFSNYVLKEKKELVEVVLTSSDKLESVPGVMGYLYSLFAENEINILETISCWTDTIFIVEKDDLSKVMRILDF